MQIGVRVLLNLFFFVSSLFSDVNQRSGPLLALERAHAAMHKSAKMLYDT